MDNEKRLKYLRDLEKLKASGIKSEDYTSPLEQDVMKVKSLAKEVPEQVTKLQGMTEKIDTKGIAPIISGSDFSSKIEALRALKKAGKKVAGIIPLAGAGMAALSGDPAMAAEELAGDIPVAGQIYEAIKPTESGNPEEEAQMLAERDAMEQYKGSPAAKDRLSKLKALIGKK